MQGTNHCTHSHRSLPTRGGWIEINGLISDMMFSCGPSPHGEGGLKWYRMQFGEAESRSLPTRGGWIEIGIASATVAAIPGPSPHGEGGLKWLIQKASTKIPGVPPHTGRVD